MSARDCHARFDGDLTPIEEYAGLEPWPLGRVRLGASLVAAVCGLVAVTLAMAHPTGWPLLGFAAGLVGITTPVLVAARHQQARIRRLKAAWPHRHDGATSR
ncbi:hypothetical protein [Streptomyces sp. NPDC001492]